MPSDLSRGKRFNDLNRDTYESPEALVEYGEIEGLRPVEDALIRKHFTEKGATLDLGCGGGRTTVALWKAGYPVIGLDLSAGLVEAARKKYSQIEFKQGDVRSLPFESGMFDQVLFSFNGFDHLYPVEDFLKGLGEIRRVLRPGGALIYSGHNILGLLGRNLKPLKKFFVVGLPEIIKTLSLQSRNAQPWRWYWRYQEWFGYLVMFSAPPSVHRKLHDSGGFETVEVVGGWFHPVYHSERWLTFREHHIHYALRRKG
jgi:SAM-dependent methyltransferase